MRMQLPLPTKKRRRRKRKEKEEGRRLKMLRSDGVDVILERKGKKREVCGLQRQRDHVAKIKTKTEEGFRGKEVREEEEEKADMIWGHGRR